MVILVVGWLRNVDRRPVELGWLEQARGAAFAEHTGDAGSTSGSLVVDDEDDAARAAYNAWLARLEK
jgi:hypothetical protein